MTRALYVDINLIHLNPSATNFPQLIEAAMPNVSFYGPGFSPSGVLAKGLLDWVRETGPYGIIFIGPNTPLLVDNFNNVIDGTLAYMRRYTAHDNSEADVVAFFKDVLAVLPNVDVEHRIVTSLNFDYYAATDAQVQRVNDLNLTLIGPNEQFVRPLAELPGFVKLEKHYQRKKARLSDCWFDFLHSHPERVITALHYVVPSEFSYTPIDLRQPVVAIPGVEYHLRKEANVALRQSGIRMASKWYFHLFRVMARMGVPVYQNPWGLHLYNYYFQRTLKTSRYVYTARGGFGLPIRKFFEIPAAGTVMICTPPSSFSELGFCNGKHYVEASPHELPEVVAELMKAPERAQSIADAGRELVWRRHSLSARADQLRQSIEALMAGQYAGSIWKQGEHCIQKC